MNAHNGNNKGNGSDPKLAEQLSSLQSEMDRLNEIGIALSSEKNLNKLLEMIVDETRGFTNCDSGTLYRVDEKKNTLKFEIMQTQSTGYFAGGTTDIKITVPPVPLMIDGKPNLSNVSAHVALSGEVVNIDDVYETKDFDFTGPKKYDEMTGYRTQSMLVIPMMDHTDKVIGVLQLINSLGPEGERIPFDIKYESMVRSLASQAAVAINNTLLIAGIENLFKALIVYTVKAIDARSPHTAGHSSRVAKLSRRIAETMNLVTTGPYKDISFTADQLEEIWVSGLLHDVGKIGVAEAVLEKQKKLDGAKFTVVADRFNAIRLYAIIRSQLRNMSNGHPVDTPDEILEKELVEWQEDYDFLQWVNNPGFLAPDKKEKLDQLNEKTFVDPEGREHAYIDDEEYLNFSVVKGNLTAAERKIIQSHVVQTGTLLNKLPFVDKLARVPEYAASHHEWLNGKGYPDGLSGDQIPLPSRIMCVADVWDALTAQDRPYKPPIPADKSCDILRSGAEHLEFDPDVVDLFITHRLWEKKPGEMVFDED